MSENALKEAALVEFVAETEDMLERISLHLDEIERGHPLEGVINEIYRDIHSIKGSSYLFGLKQMGHLAHAIESSLDPIRNGKLQLGSYLIESIYHGLDLLKELNNHVKSMRSEPDVSQKLEKIIPRIVDNTLQNIGANFRCFKDVPTGSTNLNIDKSEIELIKSQDSDCVKKDGKTATELKIIDLDDDFSTQIAPGQGGNTIENGTNETLRVAVSVLDKLMNLVGELVLIRNQHLQFNSHHQESVLAELNQRLNVVTYELQDEIMKTRMQPIGTILSTYYRVVRDLSKQLGKSVKLVLEGNETELDKTLLEAIRDPLMHIVRNSVDHGIELPGERADIAKNPVGTVRINSFHEGGQVVVEIEDDGRGLCREKISRKAVEAGLISQEKIEKLNDREVFMFIFAPGFSTADRVSNVSGRGVGMDVVKTNIERIGGMVDICSRKGVGTTIRLKIPLTLAIIPALIVNSGGEKFAIPQVKLVELVRVERSDDPSLAHIELLQGVQVYRLRGKLLPLIHLNQVLNLPDNPNKDSVNIVVLNADGEDFGLVVDEIENSADIVIKPLMQFIKDNSVYSGATVMGDGTIALTIDVVELASHVGTISGAEQYDDQLISADPLDMLNTDVTEYLLVDIGAPGKYAVPLCLVNRLEEFSCDSIELSGDHEVVQYRGALLPLIFLSEILTGEKRHRDNRENISVVVVKKSNQLYGLVVEKISDIFSSENEVQSQHLSSPGIVGSLIVGETVVAIIDIYMFIRDFVGDLRNIAAYSEVSSKAPLNVSPAESAKNILLVDDNAFFRNHVSKILEQAGYRVVVAKHGQDGYEILKSNYEHISAVVSDIEMPVLDGYGMAEKIKQDADLRHIPLMAITTRYRKADIERGHEVGFIKYLEKLDPEQLLAEVSMILRAA